ncbi:uncharacterized protein J4E84_009529 [Alternaria hordeiaustralica]|uniref:uncharacterized protein n=1 Tax=Alternaria hordeiaustralica TaxID=1187925 RepID=UPI0020C29D20|nr:uncharacterized protein J4E84_009529 [Alternaria hordeiaustralica]KAI4676694.1 hypothetical protein J4E84_009529 [Alternaria hordeiaustralica]
MGIVELWTLYALAVSFTCLRTYARITAVGLRELQVDDYLVWIAILIYTAQCSLGYSLGVHVHGLANDGMTPDERAALSQDDPEFRLRVIGSKIQVAGWTTSACLLWSLKLCVAAFYLRLTVGRPWDDPLNSVELTASWGTRQTFIAIFTTNLPMIFPLLKNWLSPFLLSTIGSSNAKGQEPPSSDFETIGGGSGPGGKRASRRTPHRARHTFGGLTLDNESEEDMIKGDDVAMHRMQRDNLEADGKNTIVVCSEVSVTSEDHSGVQRKASFQIM